MFSKYTDKGEKSKLLIPELKSREASKPRSIKKQSNDSKDYDTDQKKNLNQSNQSLEEIKDIVSSCNNCKTKISQFVTKKPIHLQDKGTQTTHKPFLIDLVQERVENICRQNTKLTRLVEERQEEIIQRQQEINEIQQKFTSILLSLSQQLATRRHRGTEWHEVSKMVSADTDTPSYLKALQLGLE